MKEMCFRLGRSKQYTIGYCSFADRQNTCAGTLGGFNSTEGRTGMMKLIGS